MNTVRTESGGWSRGRWLTTVGALFFIQIGLLALFGKHGTLPLPPRGTATTFHLLPGALTEQQLSENFFASDPTLFSVASWHGFSGDGWLARSLPKYEFSESEEQPHWLSNRVDQLGTFSRPETGTGATLGFDDSQTPQAEPLPYFLSPETMRTQSTWRVEGDLAQAELNHAPRLPVWSSSDLLTNSVVQLAANENGEVVSSRLMARCGWPAADREALALARRLRFRTAASHQGWRWGTIIFEWQTVPPSATNAVVLKSL